jgi:hypothetical protein
VQSADAFGAENYAALAGLVVFEDAMDLAGDVCQLFSNFAVIRPQLRSTGVEGREFRVVASREDFDDVGYRVMP